MELWEYRLIEMVRWYDPQLPFPGEHKLRPSLEAAGEDEVAVHIWRPRKGRKH